MKSIKLFLMLVGVLLGSNLMHAYRICIINNTTQNIIAKGKVDVTTSFARNLNDEVLTHFTATGQTIVGFHMRLTPGNLGCVSDIDSLVSMDITDEHDTPINVNKQPTWLNADVTNYIITEKS